MSEERYAPVWAKQQMERDARVIQALGERVAELEAAMSGNGKSMFKLPQSGSIEDMDLPSSVRHIRIKMPSGFSIDIQPDASGNGSIGTADTVQIMGVSHHGLAIWPQASNVFHISPRLI